jgi:small subunit ribosomal protein S1
MIVRGKVTKITNFGVFLELEPGLEGLLHSSGLSEEKVENPQDMVKLGDELEVKILRVDMDDRKIGLSLKRVQGGPSAEEPEPSAPDRPRKYRGGLES